MRCAANSKYETVTPSVVLLPTYNERENIRQILPRLGALRSVDVFVIDDSSPDGTATLARSLGKEIGGVSVIVRKEKQGLGRAYVHGLKRALAEGYERIVTMDADLSHSPEDVPRLLNGLESAEVAIGSRHVSGGGVEDWPLSRRVLSRCGSLYARTLLRLPASDVTSGFRAYRAEALEYLDWDEFESNGFVYQIEILRRILDIPGARVSEVPIVFRNRRLGDSKLSHGIVTEAIAEVAKLCLRKRSIPERCFVPPDSKVQSSLEHFVDVEAFAAARSLRNYDYSSADDLLPTDYAKSRLFRSAKQRSLIGRSRDNDSGPSAAPRAFDGKECDYVLLGAEPASVATRRYLSVLQRDPNVAAVGGPAVPAAGQAEGLTESVLGDPWIVGRRAARWRSFGCARFVDERELSPANLCVRKALVARDHDSCSARGSEVTEVLGRLRRRGLRLVYDPKSSAERSATTRLQRRGLFSAGIAEGRLCTRRRSLTGAVTLLGGVVLALLAWRSGHVAAVPLALGATYVAYLGVVAARHLRKRKTLRAAMAIAALGCLWQLGYLVGSVQGFFSARST